MHTPEPTPQPQQPPPEPAPVSAALSVIAQEARNVAASFGLACAGDMAAALVQRLLSHFGGQRIYFPSAGQHHTQSRAVEIRAQFTGNNLGELASKHRLTKRQVRNILTHAAKGTPAGHKRP